MGPSLEPWLAAIGGATAAQKIPLVQAALRSPAGQAWKGAAGEWVNQIVPVETLVPESAARWRPLVRDAIQFVFSRLSVERLAAKLVEQMELPPDTAPDRRLIRLISKMPGLQKIGQVLARNRHLAPVLRTALTELENGMSDVTAPEVHAIVAEQLGDRLERFHVVMASALLSEASVSAVLGFTWKKSGRERERAVFKVLKPYVPDCFAEDMALLQGLGNFLTSAERGYDFAAKDVDDMLTEVRLLLERELDFAREQATLDEAARTYRSSIGIRVPRVILPLCTAQITAMSEETGVKVTEAYPNSPIRRGRIAEQLIEALISVPLLSGQNYSVFHADPHAGNLLYDESNRELIVLDWALAERLSLESRRHLLMLAVMMVLQNRDGVCESIRALQRQDKGRGQTADRAINHAVKQFFETLPEGKLPGVLDAMRLLDQIALHGVHFEAPLFLFRKSLFTLDGVLQDVAGTQMRMDYAIVRHFLTRWAASFGLFYAPLGIKDFLAVEWNALLYPARTLSRRMLGAPAGASARGVSEPPATP